MAATSAPKKKFINLDMEEYKDLELTIAVFTQILDMQEFRDLEAGIVLQAYLPDALSAMMQLQEWSAARVPIGGAPIKVRVVKGANLPMEQRGRRHPRLATGDLEQQAGLGHLLQVGPGLRTAPGARRERAHRRRRTQPL